MWFIYALFAGVLFTVFQLSLRRILRSGRDAWAFSLFFSLIGSVITIPLFAYNLIDSPETALPQGDSDERTMLWGLMFLVGLFILLHNYLVFRANNYIEASINGIIRKFRLVWVLLLGVIFLPEEAGMFKVVGTLLTIASGILVVSKFKKPESLKGILLAFGATIVYAANVILYKYLLQDFSVAALTFLTFLLPAIINFVIMPKALSRLVELNKGIKWELVATCAVGVFANLALNLALNEGEATKVPVIVESFLVLVLAGEHFILKEREHTTHKIIAVVLTILGAALIRLA